MLSLGPQHPNELSVSVQHLPKVEGVAAAERRGQRWGPRRVPGLGGGGKPAGAGVWPGVQTADSGRQVRAWFTWGSMGGPT